jgi:polyketide synthase PksR
LADAIEINALATGYQELVAEQARGSEPGMPCHISNSKPCIGHSEIASGMASLIKVIFAMRNGVVPGIAGFTEPSEHISLDRTPFRMSDKNHTWERRTDSRGNPMPYRASINSYGLGGMNAHALLEEYVPPQKTRGTSSSSLAPYLISLSARTTERLRASVSQMLAFIRKGNNLSLADLAYTLHVGREPLAARFAVVVRDHAELANAMEAYLLSADEDGGMNKATSVFVGDSTSGASPMLSLFSGAAGKSLLQALIAERNLEKLALYWVNGGSIVWEELYADQDVHRISIPTYPFEQRKYWIDAEVTTTVISEPAETTDTTQSAVKDATADRKTNEEVLAVIAHTIGLDVDELNLNEPLVNYGFDSVLMLSLFTELQANISASIELSELKECNTLRDIVGMVSQRQSMPSDSGSRSVAWVPTRSDEFPELVRLNSATNGRPVFWIHPASGEVTTYYSLAQRCERPFYGLEMRGVVNDLPPIFGGMHAQAKFHAAAIRSLQPEGPYDLGGYSAGGNLAYDVARQLQEQGQAVETLVLVDAFDTTTKEDFAKIDRANNYGIKLTFFTTFNWALFSSAVAEGQNYLDRMIHRDEIDLSLDDKAFFDQLYELAKARGFKRSKRQMQETMKKRFESMKRLYRQWMENKEGFTPYSVLPLPDPEGVTCYYFRNGSGIFMGAMEPYLVFSMGGADMDHVVYWKEFQDNMPNFHLLDAESRQHMTVFADPKSRESIIKFCESLYSLDGKRPLLHAVNSQPIAITG